MGVYRPGDLHVMEWKYKVTTKSWASERSFIWHNKGMHSMFVGIYVIYNDIYNKLGPCGRYDKMNQDKEGNKAEVVLATKGCEG